MAFTITDAPTKEELESYSAEQLRAYYALKASNNDTLSVHSIPPTVDGVRRRTVDKYGELIAYMSIEDYQGILQGFLIGLVGARRILEIGTFIGTSAIYFANALKRNGVKGGVDGTGHKPIISLDINEEFAEIARQNFVEAGVDDYIEVIVGDANKTLASLSDLTFDLCFIDADKESYRNYYETMVNNYMIAKDGLFIFDNTSFDKVLTFADTPVPVAPDAKPLDVSLGGFEITKEVAISLHEFNEHIRKDPRIEVVMLPLYTGITLVRFMH
ncbi:hypothetical protein FBU59_001298 [Linderina macrospora]|uniref:Uncharacterized protein n=1 Tax=Linderina macrospora TaxID=4868 RepID=A0ACC1JEE3_9FUNG|nr:hypothetical protein FBU59_001298 [Linderina macrospora]